VCFRGLNPGEPLRLAAIPLRPELEVLRSPALERDRELLRQLDVVDLHLETGVVDVEQIARERREFVLSGLED
jgi:hypothetical protein